MARREARRLVPGFSAGQGLWLGLTGAALLCLLIPVRRAYGSPGPRLTAPSFLLFAILAQISLFLLAAHAVWAGTRRDAAAGSADEFILTGAGLPRMLLGKWLGVSIAGALWSLSLLPFLLLAAAFMGAPIRAVFLVTLS